MNDSEKNDKEKFLKIISDYLLKSPIKGILRVAINGVDGSGKTQLANELEQYLSKRGETVIRSSIDFFHNPKHVRYAKGRRSALGFYKDSFNIAEFKTAILEPLSPEGNRHYRVAAFNHFKDEPVNAPIKIAEEGSILLIDGIFLLNHELRHFFDISIFLDVSFKETFRRMVSRDGTPLEPNDPINLRFMDGQKLYFNDCAPKNHADIVVDYEDYNHPIIKNKLI